jgi:hypothetical protein
MVPNIIDLERFRPSDVDRCRAHLVVARNLEPIYDNESRLAIRAFRSSAAATSGGAALGRRHRSGAWCARVAWPANSAWPIRCVFTGRLDRDQMAALYRGADVVLNPSPSTTCPTHCSRRLASGVPMVSTDVGGVPFMVSHERTRCWCRRRQPARDGRRR